MLYLRHPIKPYTRNPLAGDKVGLGTSVSFGFADTMIERAKADFPAPSGPLKDMTSPAVNSSASKAPRFWVADKPGSSNCKTAMKD